LKSYSKIDFRNKFIDSAPVKSIQDIDVYQAAIEELIKVRKEANNPKNLAPDCLMYIVSGSVTVYNEDEGGI
jgi:hypothetical protein